MSIKCTNYRLEKQEIVYFFRSVQKGSLLIDSSTIDPSVAQQIAQESKASGATFVDAPVSGGEIINIWWTSLLFYLCWHHLDYIGGAFYMRGKR